MLTYKDLRSDFKMNDSGDPWGNTLGWLFSIAKRLHFEAGGAPSEWAYRPSPLENGGPDAECYEDESVYDAHLEDVERFGSVLWRYRSRLKRAELDY